MIKKPLCEVRNELSELINLVLYKKETVVITRRGKPVAEITQTKERKND